MSKFPFLRRPVRLILYAALLALVTAAALIFAWQYYLDGIILDHAIDTYAYVGTVVRSDGQIMDGDADRDSRDLADLTGEPVPEIGGPAFLEELPDGLVQWISDCTYVTRIDNRQTLAAMLGEHTRVNWGDSAQTVIVGDMMMSVSYVTPYHFLEGTVIFSKCWTDPEDEIQIDDYQIQVDRMWSDPDFTNDTIQVSYDRMKDEPMLEVGQRVFLLGDQVTTATGQVINNQTYASSPDAAEYLFGDFGLSLPMQSGVLLIPDGVDSEAYIQQHLEATGLDEYLKKQLSAQFAVTVRRTQDMKMIRLFAKGTAKTYEGRVLNPSDAGKNVCVISNGLAQRNRLSVGDIIRLSLADGCYTIQGVEGMEYAEGWETGEANDTEAPLSYGAYEEYEIVGIYTQAGRNIINTLYFPYNTIFLPADEDSCAETAKPYTFSFKVAGPDYQDFLAEFQPVLEEYGYTLIVEDTGWDDVKESFYTMQTRRQLMLLCAAAAFAAAVLVFAVLLGAHCRYEYGLRRLLGAKKREALGIYGAAFAFTAIPGAAAAVGGAWLMAVRLMKNALVGDATLPLPTDAQCAGLLAAWAAAELLAALAVLLVLAWHGERRGLLRLTRR